jgi:YjbE family integral membrane protein
LIDLFNQFQFNMDFAVAFCSILLIDIVLSGDNAVVIAMAVRKLPEKKRKLGIFLGAGAAVGLRVFFTFWASQLLGIPVLKLIGGILILWIAVTLMRETAEDNGKHKEAESLWHAVWIILIADATMSLDNILAVAGASNGSLLLLLIGLGMSIPIVVFTSNMMSILMNRYPVIVLIGAAVLGRVGGEMMVTDPYIRALLNPSKWTCYGVQVFFVIMVLIVGNRRAVLQWFGRFQSSQISQK